VVTPVCPACSGLVATPLPSANRTPEIDLHRCDECNHLWATLKATGRIVANITPLPKRKKRKPSKTATSTLRCQHCRQVGEVVIENTSGDAIVLHCRECDRRSSWLSVPPVPDDPEALA
jgi:hypothetical protein